MTSNQAAALELDEEILWFRSFGWSDRRIADRLGVSVGCIEKHDKLRGSGETSPMCAKIGGTTKDGPGGVGSTDRSLTPELTSPARRL